MPKKKVKTYRCFNTIPVGKCFKVPGKKIVYIKDSSFTAVIVCGHKKGSIIDFECNGDKFIATKIKETS